MTVARKEHYWGHLNKPAPPREGTPDRGCVEVGECRPPHRSRKQTGRWCRGRVGVEHQWVWAAEREMVNGANKGWLYADGRRRYTYDRDDKHGFTREREACSACGRGHGWRSRGRCHCGELFAGARSCPKCGYQPHQHERYGPWRYDKATKSHVQSWPDKPWRPCKCDVPQ